ncbi:MAG TPA: glycosyltransferase family 1 protein [Acidimicrobiales bacterium]|nr:glycosyltransferase family 1 protein [Acidimicrobiales bacterium]
MTGSLSLSLDVSAVPARPGGAGYYTIALARGLLGRDDVELNLIARQDDQARWKDLAGDRAAVCGVVPNARPARLAFEQVSLPRLLGSLGVEVHHAPHYTMPVRARVPCAVTVHDCTFFDHPEWHVRSKAAFFRRAIRRAARHAGVLICVSEVTSNRLQSVCDVRAPIVVAPHGVDHERFAPAEPTPGADLAALAGIGVPVDRPLVVFVGTLEPRKGVAPLVAAFDRVAETHRDATLVLGGQTGWGLAEIERALKGARHGDRIIRTGYLPDMVVPALLRRASVVAYPALQEGFGLPALEALACGAPLVTTEGTAMAEMAQGAAVLVPPGDVAALAEAVESGLGQGVDAGRRDLGFMVAAERTWESSVAAHLHAYGMAVGAPK